AAAVLAVAGLGAWWQLGGRDVLEARGVAIDGALASDEVARQPVQFMSTFDDGLAPAPAPPAPEPAAVIVPIVPIVPMPIVPAAAAIGTSTRAPIAAAPRPRKHRRSRGLKPNPYAR
ncbi:MAG TPA: hypothetical protein VFG69_21740, partial [Nannocystaceae bacterium]|nr:hypothetical protein [Nannocystaceae bacterium]